jgi:hypothetical protein
MGGRFWYPVSHEVRRRASQGHPAAWYESHETDALGMPVSNLEFLVRFFGLCEIGDNPNLQPLLVCRVRHEDRAIWVNQT